VRGGELVEGISMVLECWGRLVGQGYGEVRWVLVRIETLACLVGHLREGFGEWRTDF
jgi:hypothetical protein